MQRNFSPARCSNVPPSPGLAPTFAAEFKNCPPGSDAPVAGLISNSAGGGRARSGRDGEQCRCSFNKVLCGMSRLNAFSLTLYALASAPARPALTCSAARTTAVLCGLRRSCAPGAHSTLSSHDVGRSEERARQSFFAILWRKNSAHFPARPHQRRFPHCASATPGGRLRQYLGVVFIARRFSRPLDGAGSVPLLQLY